MNPLAHLFKRYNYINFIIFIGISLVLITLLYLNASRQRQEVQDRFGIQTEHIDRFMGNVSGYVESLQKYAADDLAHISVRGENRNGKGLMVTCAAPVYADDEFKGDITLDFLNTRVSAFKPEEGVMFIFK